MALCCLEGSTLSNRVHRNEVKVCSDRTIHPTTLCLEGSTPEEWDHVQWGIALQATGLVWGLVSVFRGRCPRLLMV
ncbi:MAG: hypothetical protein ACI4B5_07625 [Bacteroidaceae bacterium]